jgi:hypothetical protein
MKKLLWIIIVLLIGVVMVLTAPSEEKHKEAMMKAIKAYVDEEAENRGFNDNGVTRLGKNIIISATKTALNSKLKFDNYYLFNKTHVHLDGKDQMLSLGLLGMVFTFDKDMLRENLKKSSQTKEVEAVREAAAKAEAKELRRQIREQEKLQRKQAKEQRRLERKAEKEKKRKEREDEKMRKRQEKETSKAGQQ